MQLFIITALNNDLEVGHYINILVHVKLVAGATKKLKKPEHPQLFLKIKTP